MIDPKSKETERFALFKATKDQLRCPLTGRERQPEEIHVLETDVPDFKDPRLKYSNWSKFISLSILKERIDFNGCSFLTNDISKFTFIKKTKADYHEHIVDINLMPPMVIRNCLPFEVKLSFVDSSNVPTVEQFKKNEEKSLFCFKMDKTVTVELHIDGFDKVDFKLYDLENYFSNETSIELTDSRRRKTRIYAALGRENCG